MKTLVLGTIPDNFSPETHLPLGPWCFVKREDIYPDWESLSFESDPFTTPDELAEAATSTSAYANSLIPLLTEQLNKENRTFHSEKFWRLLIMPWLLYLVQTTWERQCRLKQFLQKYQSQALRVELVKDSANWEFSDTVDFVSRGILNPDYSEWLYSRMLVRNLPPAWQGSYVEKSTGYNSLLNPKPTWKTWIKDAISSRLRCSGVYGIGPVNSILWSLFLSMKPAGRCSVVGQFDSKETNTELNWMLDFQKLLQSALPVCFKDIRNLGGRKKKIKAKLGKINLIGPIIWYHESKQLNLAYRVESGEKLILTQHGGNYGELKSAPLISEIEYKQSGFLSWGWDKHQDYAGNIYAAASPYLGDFRDKHCQTNDELVFVGTLANLLCLRLDSTPQALQQLDYRKSKCDFLNSIKPALFEKTLYRPYPNEDGALKDRSYFERKFPNLKILEGDLYTRLMKCKLLALDHPVTTLSVALAANVPMVGFWDNKAWVMCRQAILYFEALQKAGVFFETGKAAAEQVNKVWDDVQGWWMQSEIQEARNAWCYQYARTSKLWWRDWMRVLWKL